LSADLQSFAKSLIENTKPRDKSCGRLYDMSCWSDQAEASRVSGLAQEKAEAFPFAGD
jgi:hypothetical protein